MKSEKYVRAISESQRKVFGNLLSENPCIEKVFGRDWIQKEIVDKLNDRFQIHPIFFKIIGNNDFSKKIEALSDQVRFRSIIRNIKTDRSKDGLDSLWNTISLFWEYKCKGLNLEFEPEILNSNKRCDIKVNFDNYDWWGETFTVNDNQVQRVESDLLNRLRIEFNERCTPNVGLSLTLETDFRKEMFHKSLEFILEKAKKVDSDCVEHSFIWNKEKIFTAEFGKLTTSTGGRWRTDSGPMRRSNNSMRVRGILKTKLQKYQFPKGDKIRRFFYIFSHDVDFDDLRAAIYGTPCFYINPKTFESQSDRNPDGLSHDHELSPIIHGMDFIVLKGYRDKKFMVHKRHQEMRDKLESVF